MINEIPRQSHLTVKDVEEATDEESNWAETESTPGRRPVRMGSLEENCGGEVSQEGSDMSLGKDKVVQGNLEEATTEVSGGPVRIEETVSTGEESLCFISSSPKLQIQIYILPVTGEDADSDSEVVLIEIPRQSHSTVKDVDEATDEESNPAAVKAETESTPGQNSNRSKDGRSQLRRTLEPNPMEESSEMLAPRIAPPPRQVQQSQNDREGAAADPNLLYDLGKAIEESRKSGQALAPEVMVTLAIQFLSRFGVHCEHPPPPYIEQNGDCLWTCLAKSANPLLKDAHLRAESFYLRMKGVGKALVAIQSMDEEGLASIQSVMALKPGQRPPGRKDILREVERYLQSGEWSGLAGDLVPYIASVFIGQPLLIIDVSGRKVYCTNADQPAFASFAGNPEKQYPCIVCRNINHFERVGLPEDSREAATSLLQQLRTSGKIAFFDSDAPTSRTAADKKSGGDVGLQERQQRQGSVGLEKVPAECSLEEVEPFDPPLTSTPRQQPTHTGADVGQQQQDERGRCAGD